MEQSPLKVAAVDIGTNSMRMLISDGETEIGRWETITGLGRGVDRTGTLSEDRIQASLDVFETYGRTMDDLAVGRRMAIATSASRDAANREEFFDRAEAALGVRPMLISGEREARLAYAGATGWYQGPGPVLVSDIGGGSTEFVTAEGGASVDIGSVRLTERCLGERPASETLIEAARDHVRTLFKELDVVEMPALIGVAGTWTEIPSIVRGLPTGTDTHGMEITREDVSSVVGLLAGLTVDESAALGTFNPKRAPVILGGVIIAEMVVEKVGVQAAVVSTRDTLDGVVAELLAGQHP